MIEFSLNGEVSSSQSEGETPLLWVLREELKLTGTKFGCGNAQCGACTVHLDGNPGASLCDTRSSGGRAQRDDHRGFGYPRGGTR
jgi:isoquinoline 1-oxidoreductase alpha subunit